MPRIATFAGAIGKVELTRPWNKGSALGQYQGQTVIVNHGSSFVHRPCLARFEDREGVHGEMIGYFLTSRIEGLSEVERGKYLLCGLWEKDMLRASKIPTIQEVEVYFDPGAKPFYYFLREHSSGRWGRAKVPSIGVPLFSHMSLGKLARDLLDSPGAPLAVAEGSEQYKRLIESVKERGWNPIELERLR